MGLPPAVVNGTVVFPVTAISVLYVTQLNVQLVDNQLIVVLSHPSSSV